MTSTAFFSVFPTRECWRQLHSETGATNDKGQDRPCRTICMKPTSQGLREDLMKSGLDSWQAADLISSFLAARTATTSPPRTPALRPEDGVDSPALCHACRKELEKIQRRSCSTSLSSSVLEPHTQQSRSLPGPFDRLRCSHDRRSTARCSCDIHFWRCFALRLLSRRSNRSRTSWKKQPSPRESNVCLGRRPPLTTSTSALSSQDHFVRLLPRTPLPHRLRPR